MSLESILAKGFKRRIKGKLKKIATRHEIEIENIISKKGKLSRREKKRIRGILNPSQRKRKRVPRSYALYIDSGHWIRRKNKYYQLHGKRCEVCGSTRFIQLHHKLYADFGYELDENLVPLCQFHHKQLHEGIGKITRNMIKKTNSLIEEMKSNLINDKEIAEIDEFFSKISHAKH